MVMQSMAPLRHQANGIGLRRVGGTLWDTLKEDCIVPACGDGDAPCSRREFAIQGLAGYFLGLGESLPPAGGTLCRTGGDGEGEARPS